MSNQDKKTNPATTTKPTTIPVKHTRNDDDKAHCVRQLGTKEGKQ